jgi:hypothetical protein
MYFEKKYKKIKKTYLQYLHTQHYKNWSLVSDITLLTKCSSFLTETQPFMIIIIAFLRSSCQLKLPGYCFFRFREKSVFQGGVVSPTTPPPSYTGGPKFSVRVISLS